MNKSIIRYIMGRVLQFEGLFMLLPAIVAAVHREYSGFVFLGVGLGSALLGTLFVIRKPKSTVFYAREGFVTVSLSWIVLSLVGALPFVITGFIPNYIDAVFETVSGFTTTGASILNNVEALDYSTQFWRCFTHWVGGMGVLVFIMAVLPLSGSHNLHLMRAESPGPEVGKLVPRIKDTAKILYGIYLGLTLLLVVLYVINGMSLYEALIYSFSTMGTGGFANKNLSLGYYSDVIQVITIIFMFLCGINFNVYFLAMRGKVKEIFKSEEVKLYFAAVILGTMVITWQIADRYDDLFHAAKDAAFQIVAVVSTTGFSTTDFVTWPMLSKAIIVLVMVTGGCAGATCGGFKMSRVVILAKTLKKEVMHLTHPRSVRKIRMSGAPVHEETSKSVVSFLVAYVLFVFVSFLLVAYNNIDFETSISSVLTMIGNVGPGLGLVGPSGNYSIYNSFSKVVLIFDMLAGRLELFPLLVLFNFGTWKKS